MCVVCVALKGFLSPPGLQLTPLLTDICPRSISIPTLCENRRNYRRNKTPQWAEASVSFQWAQASVAGRLKRVSAPDTASRRRGLESTQTRTRSTLAFRGAASTDRSSLVKALPNVLQLAEIWQRICTLASLFFPFYLTGPPRRTIISAFPWMTATKIAQVCCALLKTWQWVQKNTWVFSICISLNPSSFPQMFLLLLCYFGHQNMLESIIFLCERTICPLSWRS